MLRSFGQYSYCIYLVHILVVQWFADRMVAFAYSSDAVREESVTARYLETPGMDETSARRLADSLIAMGLTAEGWTPDVAAPQPLTPR